VGGGDSIGGWEADGTDDGVGAAGVRAGVGELVSAAVAGPAGADVVGAADGVAGDAAG